MPNRETTRRGVPQKLASYKQKKYAEILMKRNGISFEYAKTHFFPFRLNEEIQWTQMHLNKLIQILETIDCDRIEKEVNWSLEYYSPENVAKRRKEESDGYVY